MESDRSFRGLALKVNRTAQLTTNPISYDCVAIATNGDHISREKDK